MQQFDDNWFVSAWSQTDGGCVTILSQSYLCCAVICVFSMDLHDAAVLIVSYTRVRGWGGVLFIYAQKLHCLNTFSVLMSPLCEFLRCESMKTHGKCDCLPVHRSEIMRTIV